MGFVREAIQALRRYRDEIGAPAGERIRARIVTERGELYEPALRMISRLARFELEIARGDGALGEATIAIPDAIVDVQIDAEAAGVQRAEQIAKIRQEIERAEGKLADRGFVQKAPPELVQQEREKLERFQRELAELEG